MSKQASNRFRNRILQKLSPEAIERLGLTAIPLPTGRELESPGQAITNVFFVESGVGSTTMRFADGSEVEVGLFGFESAIGVSGLMGTKRSLNRIFMQVEGHGYVSRLSKARAEFALGGEFQALTLRNMQVQLNQAAVSAACNLKHKVNQRLAKWLLLCSDRSSDDSFNLSQRFLAVMLGTRRSTITVSMNHLSELGIISHRRRRVEILDRASLEAEACECYGMLRKHLDFGIESDEGFVV